MQAFTQCMITYLYFNNDIQQIANILQRVSQSHKSTIQLSCMNQIVFYAGSLVLIVQLWFGFALFFFFKTFGLWLFFVLQPYYVHNLRFFSYTNYETLIFTKMLFMGNQGIRRSSPYTRLLGSILFALLEKWDH